MEDIVGGQSRRRRPSCILERSRIGNVLILLNTKSLGSIPDPFSIEETRQKEEGGGMSILSRMP